MKEDNTRVSRAVSPWLTVPQAAAYVQMDVQPFRQLVYSGAIPSRKRSEKRIFIHATWLDEYMEALPSGAKVPEVLR
jgi:hypothetical protein